VLEWKSGEDEQKKVDQIIFSNEKQIFMAKRSDEGKSEIKIFDIEDGSVEYFQEVSGVVKSLKQYQPER
jgi:hypothetical protein